jgi:glycosyltransferase involved in cell wall biosynthesis
MLKLILPHGSGRRARAKEFILRLKRRRIRQFHQREYNDYRQEYYRTANRLFIDGDSPLISIVVPCWNTPYRYLQALVDSVYAQGYENWELVLVDVSSDSTISSVIEKMSKYDMRIVYKKLESNDGIAKNTNVAMKMAQGDYIAFLDHDDTLDPDALAYAVKAIQDHDPDLIYSDEDKINDEGTRYFEPHFKPDFSLSILRCVNYITHFVVVKKSIAEKVGYIEHGFDGAQDYNFLLNIVDITDKIYHIPRILYHWRQAVNSTASDFSNKTHIKDAGVKALTNHLKRRKVVASARAIDNRPGFYEVNYELKRAKRAVVIDLPNCNTKEVEFIKSIYENHSDVKHHNIDVITKSLNDIHDDNYDEIVYVSKPIAPMNNEDKSINKLFGMLQTGARFTSPKKMSRGKIVDCGLVSHKGFLVSLFYGTDPTALHYFGTHEWNREVNGLKWGVICGGLQDIKKESRQHAIVGKDLVLVGQTEYDAFDEAGHKADDYEIEPNYFNPNLETEIYPRLIKDEPLRERIPVGK